MKLRRTTLLLLILCAALPLAAAHAQDAAKPDAKPDAAKQALHDQLYEAARKGDAAEVKALLDKGADVNAKFRYGATALFKAAERGHTEVVRLLLERGADPKVQDTFYRATAISWALQKKHVEVVRLLLDKDAGAVDDVLLTGAREPDAAIVNLALGKGGARPETLTRALIVTTKAGKADLVEALRKAGAQPPPALEAALLAAYAGKYKPEQGNEITVGVADGQLTATPTGQRPIDMMATDKTTFVPVAFDGITVTFVSEGDKVTGLTLKQGPNTTAYKKQ